MGNNTNSIPIPSYIAFKEALGKHELNKIISRAIYIELLFSIRRKQNILFQFRILC